MHFAHMTLRTLRPSTRRVIFCRFGRKVRFVARWEKLRLWPKVVVFPQDSHFAIDEFLSEILVKRGANASPRSEWEFYHNPYLLTRKIV